jgi:hypothetical protein
MSDWQAAIFWQRNGGITIDYYIGMPQNYSSY